MSRSLLDLNYDDQVPDHWHEPLDAVPDPELPTTTKQTEYFYKICQLLLDAGRLTRCRTIYVMRLVELITAGLPANPASGEVANYLQLTAALCHQLGLDQAAIQRAGVPILLPPETPHTQPAPARGRQCSPDEIELWKLYQ
jgi:hypothetical protein